MAGCHSLQVRVLSTTAIGSLRLLLELGVVRGMGIVGVCWLLQFSTLLLAILLSVLLSHAFSSQVFEVKIACDFDFWIELNRRDQILQNAVSSCRVYSWWVVQMVILEMITFDELLTALVVSPSLFCFLRHRDERIQQIVVSKILSVWGHTTRLIDEDDVLAGGRRLTTGDWTVDACWRLALVLDPTERGDLEAVSITSCLMTHVA